MARNGDRVFSEALGVAEAFAGMPVDAVTRFAAAGRKRRFRAGTALVQQGAESTSMFVLLSGSVRVTRAHPDLRDPVILATLGPGDVVGEMGVLDRARRSATVTAIEDTVAAEIEAERVGRMVIEHPDLYGDLVRVLSKRLRTTDELAAEIQARQKLQVQK